MTIISGSCGDNLTYVLNNDYSLVISGTGAMYDYSNSSSNRVPWFNFQSWIYSIIISSGVTTIGKYAFSNCTALTSITIPDTVITIGNSAFHRCTALTSITIPNSVTTIDHYAFDYCEALTSVTIPNSVITIGNHAFDGCYALASVSLPSGLTSIGEYAFYRCTSLPSITLPDTVTSVGSCAFYQCFEISSITFLRSSSTGMTFSANCFNIGTSSNPVTTTIYSPNNWASTSVLDNQLYKGAYTTFNFLSLRITNYLTYNNAPIQVDSGIYDEEGNDIAETYAKKADVPNVTVSQNAPSDPSEGDIWIQY